MMTLDGSSSQPSDLSQTLLASKVCSPRSIVGTLSEVEVHLSRRQVIFFCNPCTENLRTCHVFPPRRVSDIFRRISIPAEMPSPGLPPPSPISPTPCGAFTVIISEFLFLRIVSSENIQRTLVNRTMPREQYRALCTLPDHRQDGLRIQLALYHPT